MPFDASKYTEHRTFNDSATGLSFIVGVRPLPEVFATIGGQPSALAMKAVDTHVQVPVQNQADFAKKLKLKNTLPEDGIALVATDTTAGQQKIEAESNMKEIFSTIKNGGYPIAETTKLEAMRYAENCISGLSKSNVAAR